MGVGGTTMGDIEGTTVGGVDDDGLGASGPGVGTTCSPTG